MNGTAEPPRGGEAERAQATDRLLRLAAIAVIVAVAVAGLIRGAPILVPLAEALLIWFVVNALAASMRRLPGIGRHLSAGVARWTSAAVVALLGLVAVYSGARALVAMGPQAMQLQSSLEPLMGGVSAVLGAETSDVLDRAFDAVGLETLVRQIVLGLLGLVNQFGLVGIYVGFLLFDQTFFPAKLRLLVRDPARHAATRALLDDLGRQIGAYLWIMTKVSAATATLSFAVFRVAGLENAFFWALLVFLLNFIPTIGSVLATLLPSIFALVQFQDFGATALLAVALGIVQFTIGNIVLPRMAGRTLNLSLTVTILCLFLWGALWGVTGMFLAVPITASLILVASRFAATRWIAVALSRTGEPFPPASPPPAAAPLGRGPFP
jgi:predicted PurR-regulated permease PerM